MRVRVKICGLTRPDQAAEVSRLGADAIGVVFAAHTPRCLSVADARRVCEAVAPFVTTVGVFRDPTADAVRAALDAVALDWLQFHGDEPPAFCDRWGRPWLKAVAMGGPAAGTGIDRYARARGFLFDAHAPGEAGGQGARFDWRRLPEAVPGAVVLAGGLEPGNVFDAVKRTRPYGVDVSSGVESSPGIKDMEKVSQFIDEVRRAERDAA